MYKLLHAAAAAVSHQAPSAASAVLKSLRTLPTAGSCIVGPAFRPCSTSAAGQPNASTPEADEHVMVLPMPSLSHAMTHGTISKWHKAEGSRVSIYDILLEVSTDSLVEEAFKVGDFGGTVTLLLESQEEGTLQQILVPEGHTVPVGTPIAIIDEADTDEVQSRQYSCPTSNVYDPEQPAVRVLEWQSYLKEGKGPGDDCGCM